VLRLEPDSGLPIIGILRSKIQGQSLKEIIDSRRSTSPSEVLELLKKTLPILAHIHDQTDNRTGHKIVHSDIKPANIILDIDGNPKLIDFGVARQFQPGHTFQHTVGMRGTLDYCPPEQLTGGGVPASDIYSLGVTVIHALLGFMPPELRENWRKSEPFTIPKDIEISKEFTRILRKMIHPNLEWRYQNADEVLDDLQNPSLLVTQSSSWYSRIFWGF
jgi:serine/threonine protein kinase